MNIVCSALDAQVQQAGEPTVIFVIGANGMGKTTTIGKLASTCRPLRCVVTCLLMCMCCGFDMPR